MNSLRLLALAAVLTAASSAPAQSPVERYRASEAQVHALPIHQRPNRLGHIYGNNVRRLHHGTFFVNAKHTERPLARFFYVTR